MIALFATIDLILGLYTWVIIISAILSWLLAFGVINRHNPVVDAVWRVVTGLTEPVFRPIRQILPDLGGIDISPIVVLVAIFFLRTFIATSIQPMFV